MTDDPKKHLTVEATHIQPDGVDAKLLGALAVMCALLLIITVVLLETWYYTESLAERKKFEAQPSQALAEMQQRQERQLSYRWVDKSKHIAAIPIAQAMKLTQRDLTTPSTTQSAEHAEADAR